MKPLVWIVVTAVCGLLAAAFLRALPGAVERQRTGREAALKAVCEPALRPEAHSAALGQIGPEGAAAPEFTLKDWAGRKVALSSLRGRVVLVNFWATWCDTCVVEMPGLDQLAAAEKNRPFSLLAISVDENWDVVRQFFAQGTALTVLLDKEKSVPPRYGTEKFPESFLIDRDGKVRYFVVSDRNWASPDIRACIDQLIDG
ncbi:MAG: TlpA family protein disulfide reductase [Myxococcales bacterium]|nr:TlpA family protein disulfide reductase [Myxococcales bacterium]